MEAKLRLWTSYWLGMKLLASMMWACLASDKKQSVWWKAHTRRWSSSWKGKLVSLAGTPNVFQPTSYWATEFAKIWQVNDFHSVLLMCILCGVQLILKHRLFMDPVWREAACWSGQSPRQYILWVLWCGESGQCLCPPEVQCSKPCRAVSPASLPLLCKVTPSYCAVLPSASAMRATCAGRSKLHGRLLEKHLPNLKVFEVSSIS